MVDGLEETYAAEMDFHQKDYSTEESKAEMKRAGVEDLHGMAIIGSDGSPIWHEDGHEQKRDVVEAQIKQALADPEGQAAEEGG